MPPPKSEEEDEVVGFEGEGVVEVGVGGPTEREGERGKFAIIEGSVGLEGDPESMGAD